MKGSNCHMFPSGLLRPLCRGTGRKSWVWFNRTHISPVPLLSHISARTTGSSEEGCTLRWSLGLTSDAYAEVLIGIKWVLALEIFQTGTLGNSWCSEEKEYVDGLCTLIKCNTVAGQYFKQITFPPADGRVTSITTTSTCTYSKPYGKLHFGRFEITVHVYKNVILHNR